MPSPKSKASDEAPRPRGPKPSGNVSNFYFLTAGLMAAVEKVHRQMFPDGPLRYVPGWSMSSTNYVYGEILRCGLKHRGQVKPAQAKLLAEPLLYGPDSRRITMPPQLWERLEAYQAKHSIGHVSSPSGETTVRNTIRRRAPHRQKFVSMQAAIRRLLASGLSYPEDLSNQTRQ